MPRSLVNLRLSVYRTLLKLFFTFQAKRMSTGYTDYQHNQVAQLSAYKALTRSLLEYRCAVVARITIGPDTPLSPALANLCRETIIYPGPAPTIDTALASFEMNFRHLPIPVFHQAADYDRCGTLYFDVCAHCYQNQRMPFRHGWAAESAWASSNGSQAEIARFYHDLYCQPLEIEVFRSKL
ncbi:hypothetical protein C8J57DRAFT_1511362 [Mycena rebaudengoi]|nr:hypothetical protein C8J57DRAFT_1511362 [Mycena rebaudengoi]